MFLEDIRHLTPSYWSVSELRNRLNKSKRDRENQTAQRQRVQTEKGKEKRKRRQLTGGRDRWETRAAATMMETRCRPLQYTKDGERAGSEMEHKGARRMSGLIEGDMIRRKNETDTDRKRGNGKEETGKQERQTDKGRG